MSPKAPPRGFRQVPPGGFCASVFLLLRDAEGRVLVGRYREDAPEIPALTGLDPERLAKYSQGMTLPARHLQLGESPEDAARSIGRAFVGLDVEPRLLRVWAESYAIPMYPGETHHDLIFAYEARIGSAPPAPPWYAELRLARSEEVAWARHHEDVVEAALLVALPFQAEWRASVLDGRKTTTVRTRRFGAPGEAFEVDGARFVLTAVEAMPLARARDEVWREEGMASLEEFERVWARNHPARGFRGADSVWVHRFRRAPLG